MKKKVKQVQKKIEFLIHLCIYNSDMLIKNIENIISANITEYISRIADKYNIDNKELENIWNIISQGTEVVVSKEKPKKEKAKKTDDTGSVSGASVKSKNKSVEGGCPYVFIKGKDEGTICNSKPKDGAEYCSRHQKCEGVGQKDKKKIPVAKKTVSSKVSSPKVSPAKKPTEKVLRLNKEIDKFWNPESGLVFKSKDDRVVIGSYKNEKFEKLTDDDIATCEKFGFKYEIEKSKPAVQVLNPKKSLSEEIVKTNMHAEHVEDVLTEIGLGYEEEPLEDEIFDEDIEEDEEDEEEDDGEY